MAYCRRRDFLFCDLCGTMLSFNSTKYAKCPLCGSRRNAKDIVGRETCYTVTAEDIRRELSIEPIVEVDGIITKEVEVKRTIIADKCRRCGHDEALSKSINNRGADEGQTNFYECPKCGFVRVENS